MKLLTKALLLCLFLATLLFAAFIYIKTNLGINPISAEDLSNMQVLPFTFEQELGAHGSDHLTLTTGKDYPYLFYYFRSGNADFIPENSKVVEYKASDERFYAYFIMPYYQFESKVQACNPFNVCKTFKITCEEHKSGPASKRCITIDIPDEKNKLQGMKEVKIIHDDVEGSIDYASVDDNLKVFGEEGLYETTTSITKIKSKNRIFKSQNVSYGFDENAFNQESWDLKKEKLRGLANSLSNGAKIKETEETQDYDLAPGFPQTERFYTITWESSIDVSGLEDYGDFYSDNKASNSIELRSRNEYGFNDANYNKNETNQWYGLHIHTYTQIR